MEKVKLVRMINKAMRIEEEAVPALAQHISAAVNFIETDPKVIEKVTSIMDQLAEDSIGHAQILKDMLEIINREDKNVY